MRYAIILILLFVPSALFGKSFKADDPIWKDPDQKNYPKPLFKDIGEVNDLVAGTFVYPRKNKKNPPGNAVNINTLGEVPDSSWFTNRIGRNPMSIDELVRGPNTSTVPDNSVWTIVEAKSQGVTPGFVIQDGRGDIYVIKFDPKNNRQLASSAEAISTKFFHAFGYNVPENYLAMMTPEILLISPTAIITDENGQKRKMTDKDLDAIIRRVPVNPDGTIQVLASRKIPGESIGPFSFYGTRSDDANDIFPHQDRRELRALKVFCSWLNHDEVNTPNSLDAFIGSSNSGYVKHYLLDFNSTMGSANIKINEKRAGNEYVIEWGPIFKSAASLGIIDRPWRSVKYPDYPSIGRFESKFFQPEKWKPDHPNAAFDRMLPEDAFWAAEIISKFTDEMVHVLVKTGRYMDPEAEEYLYHTLLQRRDKIIRYYFSQVNPISGFSITNDQLNYTNPGVTFAIGTVGAYQYQWHSFNNSTGKLEPAGQPQTTTATSIPIPAIEADYSMVRIQCLNSSVSAWNQSVDLYLRNSPQREIVGIER